MTNKEVNNKKRNLIIVGILLLLLLCVSLGSAYLSQMLQINGTTNIGKSSWSIYFDNEEEQSGSVEATNPLTIDTSKTLITFGVTFTKPGEFYEFEVDTVNDGAMDAMVNRVTKIGISEENAKYINFEATYSDGAPIQKYDLLAKQSRERIKVRVEFKEVDNKEDLPPSDLELNLELQIEYIQSDENAHEREEVQKDPAILKASALVGSFLSASSETSKVKRIIFDNKINMPGNAIATGDISEAQDGRVIAYTVPNADDSTKYDLHIEGDGSVYANPNSSYAFMPYSNVEEIIGANKLNTSLVTNMSNMFNNCRSLVSIDDTSNWDLSNVTNMSNAFRETVALKAIRGSGNWNLNKVTDMSNAFQNTGLEYLEANNWGLESVTNMQEAFKNCGSLVSIEENWNLSNVTLMNATFQNCMVLTNLDTSTWNLNNVISMVSTFQNCTALTYIDGSSWGFKTGADLSLTFNNCTALVEINASNWNLDKASLYNTFKDCSSLEKINISNWDTSTVTSFTNTFAGCNNLSEIDLSIFKFGSAYPSQMFAYCHKLNGELNITSNNVSFYGNGGIFFGITPANGEQIVINYTAEIEEYIDAQIQGFNNSYKDENHKANIIKGTLIS